MKQRVDLIAEQLDSFFQIARYTSLDTSFSKRISMFDSKIQQRIQPDFRQSCNGLMLKSSETISCIAATCFLCDEFVAELRDTHITDTFVVTHHMMDIDAGTPGLWNAKGFFALSAESFNWLEANRISIYVLHLPLDANASEINTHAALCRRLSMTPMGTLLYRPGYEMGYTVSVPKSLYEIAKMRFARTVSFGQLPPSPRCVAVLAGMVSSATMLEEISRCGCELLICGDVLLRQDTPRTREVVEWLHGQRLSILCLSHKETEEPALWELLDWLCRRFAPLPALFLRGGIRWK